MFASAACWFAARDAIRVNASGWMVGAASQRRRRAPICKQFRCRGATEDGPFGDRAASADAASRALWPLRRPSDQRKAVSLLELGIQLFGVRGPITECRHDRSRSQYATNAYAVRCPPAQKANKAALAAAAASSNCSRKRVTCWRNRLVTRPRFGVSRNRRNSLGSHRNVRRLNSSSSGSE